MGIPRLLRSPPNPISSSLNHLIVIPYTLKVKMRSNDRGSQLPIISIAPYWNSQSANTTEREAVSKALHSACVEYGFFYLDISHCIDLAEPEELTRLAREFFYLPQAEKDMISLRYQDFARGTDESYF